MNDAPRFCSSCGNELVNGICPQCSKSTPVRNPQTVNESGTVFNPFFADQNENYVCSLGNGYIQDFLKSGSSRRGFAVASDERLYFNGKTYNINDKKYRADNGAKSVDLKDITEISIKSAGSPGLLVMFIACVALVFMFTATSGNFLFCALMTLISAVPLLGYLLGYLATKKTFCVIHHYGGCIALDTKRYSKEEQDQFINLLSIAVEKAREDAGNIQGFSASSENDDVYKPMFMRPKERFVCSLGNGYVQQFLANGFIGNGFSVVSDKRVYFNGRSYTVTGRKVRATNESRTVDLKDVTGTGVRTVTYPVLIVFAILAAVLLGVALPAVIAMKSVTYDTFGIKIIFAILTLLGTALVVFPYFRTFHMSGKTPFLVVGIIIALAALIVAPIIIAEKSDADAATQFGAMFIAILFYVPTVVLFYTYFKSRKTLLTISYAGGCIAFDINWYPKRESDSFQKMLRIAKDKAVEEAENATANAMRDVISTVTAQPAMNVQPQVSNADELVKYAQLYKDGLLSDEEFAAIKAKIIQINQH